MRSRKQPKRKVMTKTVKDREKFARELAGASRRWSRKAAADLAALLEPALAEDFARLAGWLEATYRAAGLDRLADAMHPSGRSGGASSREIFGAMAQRMLGPARFVNAAR